MIADRTLALVIAVWTALTWGGRIGLLTGSEAGLAKARIAVSILLAAAAVIALISQTAWKRPALAAYAAGALLIWGSSLVAVWTDPTSSFAFRAVHTLLAVVSMGIAGLAVAALRRSGPVAERSLEESSPADR